MKHVATQSEAGSKPNLLADVSNPEDTAIPIWLVLTTKKYITDSKKLKPTPVHVPHPLTNPTTTTLCLIVKDPQRHYKDLVEEAGLSSVVTRVIGVGKLKKKFKTYESLRQLFDSHDMFIADDRIVTMLPTVMGKTFYKKTAKMPVPVAIAGAADSANSLKKTVTKVLESTFVHLAPASSTSIRVALSSFTPEQVVENISAVMDAMTGKKIPGGWKNVKTVHIKTAESASLPIYMAGEIYGDEDVLKPEEAQEKAAHVAKQIADRAARKEARSAKRKGLSETKPAEEEAAGSKGEKEEEAPKAKKVKVAKENK